MASYILISTGDHSKCVVHTHVFTNTEPKIIGRNIRDNVKLFYRFFIEIRRLLLWDDDNCENELHKFLVANITEDTYHGSNDGQKIKKKIIPLLEKFLSNYRGIDVFRMMNFIAETDNEGFVDITKCETES